MPDEVDYFSIAKLELAPGDILVVKLDVPVMNHNLIDYCRAMWGPLLPPDCRILVIGQGIELSTITKAEIEAKAT